MMEDIARALPDPPPPRPAARRVAIAAALARFDGDAAAVPASVSPRRWAIRRGPAMAFASVVLVALIGIPVAMLHPDGHVAVPLASEATPSTTADVSPALAPMPATTLPSRAAAPTEARPQPAPLAASRAIVVDTASPPPSPILSAPPPPPAPAPPPPPAASVAAPQAMAAEPPVAELADRASGDVVVTGSRVSRSDAAAARRGDWNACTVDDPDRQLQRCTALLRTSARGSADVAAHLSEGLAQAWQGDWDQSIAAFDAAIALKPKLAVAYLDRGMIYWRSGDAGRAASDLDRAVRYAPSARAYYVRARFRRSQGNRRGAEADEARAVELDADYAVLIEN